MRKWIDNKTMRGALAPLICVCVLSTGANAADENGKFAIKGGGLQTCEKFLDAMEKQNRDVALYGGWIEGFITAQNQHSEATFDLTPWQTTRTLLELTRAGCKQVPPTSRFIDVFAKIFRILVPARLQAESEIVGLSNGTTSAVAYREILKRLQIALRDQGYPITDENGDFDEESIGFLRDYQRKKGLTETGLPDQQTLYSLFFKK